MNAQNAVLRCVRKPPGTAFVDGWGAVRKERKEKEQKESALTRDHRGIAFSRCQRVHLVLDGLR